jgi:molybdate transport system ATP-binding protein
MLETIAVQGYSTILHVTHNPEEVLTCEKWLLELIPGGNPMYRITARNP